MTYFSDWDDGSFKYNEPFNLFELDNAFSSLKLTSPGFDNVHNHMLKMMPIEYKKFSLNIINQCYNESYIPDNMKLAIVLPILKPEKPINEVTSYRPIALLQCFSKLMEKLINVRLNYYIEIDNKFRKTQLGFRKRMTTLDNISRYEQTIRKSIYENKYCISIFFDLSNAYDKVWHLGLLYKLVKCGIRGNLLRWIQSFLLNRSFKVYLDGEFSSVRKAKSGVPQGSILSPTLFNIMLSDLPQVEGVDIAEYADDILIYTTSKDIKQASDLIQKQVDAISTYTKTGVCQSI